MQISMYQASVPQFLQMMENLIVILGKAEAHCEARNIKPEVMVATRLIPDMLPFSSQIQIAGDMAKGCIARLAGIEIPSYADTETTLVELKARLAKTIAFIKSVTPAQIDGSEEKEIVLKLRRGEKKMTGRDYFLHFVMPNFYFHVTTAYDILRVSGVDLGKMDFTGDR